MLETKVYSLQSWNNDNTLRILLTIHQSLTQQQPDNEKTLGETETVKWLKRADRIETVQSWRTAKAILHAS